MSAPKEWHCSKVGCDLTIEQHSFALVIEHIYGGVESVSGRNFNREESEEIAERVWKRLEAWS